MERVYTTMDAASYSINWQTIFISDSAVFSHWSPSDTACLTAEEQLEQELTELRDIVVGSSRQAYNRSPRLRDCSVETVNIKRNMNWKSRGLTSRRRNTLGICSQGIACFRSQGEIFSVFHLRDEQQQNKQRTPDATRPERCHCNYVWELKRARFRSRRVQWRCGIITVNNHWDCRSVSVVQQRV